MLASLDEDAPPRGRRRQGAVEPHVLGLLAGETPRVAFFGKRIASRVGDVGATARALGPDAFFAALPADLAPRDANLLERSFVDDGASWRNARAELSAVEDTDAGAIVLSAAARERLVATFAKHLEQHAAVIARCALLEKQLRELLALEGAGPMRFAGTMFPKPVARPWLAPALGMRVACGHSPNAPLEIAALPRPSRNMGQSIGG